MQYQWLENQQEKGMKISSQEWQKLEPTNPLIGDDGGAVVDTQNIAMDSDGHKEESDQKPNQEPLIYSPLYRWVLAI